jgi:hypothetical protein
MSRQDSRLQMLSTEVKARLSEGRSLETELRDISQINDGPEDPIRKAVSFVANLRRALLPYADASVHVERLFKATDGLLISQPKDSYLYYAREVLAKDFHFVLALLDTLGANLRSGRGRPVDSQMQEVKRRIREMLDVGYTHVDICKDLGNAKRPPGATWKDLPWPEALRQHPNNVKAWISKVGKARSQ